MFHSVSVLGPVGTRWGHTYAENGIFIAIEIGSPLESPEQGSMLLEHIVSLCHEYPISTLARVKNIVTGLSLPPSTTIILAVAVENVLYISSRGTGSIYLLRDGQLACILQGSQTRSGPFQEKDTFVICSPSFSQSFSNSQLTQALHAAPTLIDLEDYISSQLFKSPMAQGASCLIVRYEQVSSHQDDLNPRQNVLKQSSTRQKRITLGIGVLLLIVLSTSVFFGSEHRRKVKLKEAYDQVKGVATNQLSEAETLVGINNKAAYEILSNTKQQIEDALSYFPDNVPERKKLEELRDSTEQALKRSKNIYELKEPELFFNIDWVNDGGSGSRIALDEDTIVILDTDKSNIYKVSISHKDPEILLSQEGLKSALFIAHDDPSTYAFITDPTPHLVNSRMKTIIDTNSKWGTIKDFKMFSGNIYLLDNTGIIWKYPSSETGFGEGYDWLGPGLTLDFSDARSMSIDGNIWILDDNNVQKFSNTVPESFYLKDEVLISPVRMYTDEKVNYLYILEKNRVILFDKNGNYHSQYVWNGFSDATDLVATADSRSVLVLVKNKIYRLDIDE